MPEGGTAGRRTSMCKGPEEDVLGDVQVQRDWSRGSRGWCYREQGGSRAHVVSVTTGFGSEQDGGSPRRLSA